MSNTQRVDYVDRMNAHDAEHPLDYCQEHKLIMVQCENELVTAKVRLRRSMNTNNSIPEWRIAALAPYKELERITAINAIYLAALQNITKGNDEHASFSGSDCSAIAREAIARAAA